MFPWCLHSPQQQQSNSFRPRTTLNLHNDAILDLNCTAGHLLLSPHRQTDTVAGRINPLCCANMSTHSLLSLSRSLSRYNDFSQQSYSSSSSVHVSHPHTAWCGGAFLPDLPGGWEGSSGLARSDAVHRVSGRYFSEEKICVSGYQVSCCSSRGTNSPESPRSSSSRRRCGGGASSDVIGQVEQGAFMWTLRPRATRQLVTTGAITRLQHRLRWAQVTEYTSSTGEW